jgi:hypothetical protein
VRQLDRARPAQPGVWLHLRIADQWSEVRRLERLDQPVRAQAHRAAVDRLLDRLYVEHLSGCRCDR